jgi:hypothetical protein
MTRALARRRLAAGRVPTFKELRVMYQETDRQMKEIREQHDKEFQESKWKSEQEWKEIREQVKATDKKFGELGIRFGEVVEHLVAAGIEEKFNKLGYHFSEVAPEGHKIFDDNGQKKAQIDILLENGETVMAVEVKSKPNNKDIKEHIERLQILRESRSRIEDKRKIEGAIAGAVFKDNVKTAARDAGLFVIVQAGDTMNIEVPEGWKPRAW